MQAVILAGGRGKRLRPITDKIPKPMVKIEGKPFLQYQLELLSKYGIKNIVLCVGYLKNMIIDYFRDGSEYGINIVYSEEEEALDTGGALKNAQSHLDDLFLVLNGDTYLPINYIHLLYFFKERKPIGMMVVYNNERNVAMNNVQVADDGRILSYRKSDGGKDLNGVDAGVYIFRKEIVRFFPRRKAFSLEKEVFPKIIERGKMIGFVTNVPFYDIGTPERLRKFIDFIRKKNIDVVSG